MVVAHPVAHRPEQGLALFAAETYPGAIQVSRQRLQRCAPFGRVLGTEVIQPGFTMQAGGSVIAALLEQLLEAGVDLGQPFVIGQLPGDGGKDVLAVRAPLPALPGLAL